MKTTATTSIAIDQFPMPDGYQELIRDEVQKILASPEFTATEQQRNFLRYVVSEALAGRADRIKGYSVATQVFGRSEDFDASFDPIVSIQANKLRRALERYYLLDGKFDLIVIDIPKGSYIPTFLSRESTYPTTAEEDKKVQRKSRKPWPILKIIPFRNTTGDPGKDYFGTGIAAELTIAISQFDNFRVCYARQDIAHAETHLAPRFILDGEVFQENEKIKLLVYLIDARTNIQIWSDICTSAGEVQDIYAFKDRIVHVIAAKICGEFGILPQIVRKESGSSPPRELNTHEAILRYWEYEQHLTPESFQKAFEALTYAIAIEPDCSQTLISLAILYCTIHNLGIEGFEDPANTATVYAEKAALLSPGNQRVLSGLAYARLTAGEVASAACEARKALALNPDSLFMLDGIAWLLTLCGDWHLGPELAQKAIDLNPYHREITHNALWLNYVRKGEYDLAYLEACSLKRYTTLFWDSLIRSSTCGLMGKTEEGGEFVGNLLKLRPDFSVKGRELISNYVKFDDIVERILNGLRLSGLRI